MGLFSKAETISASGIKDFEYLDPGVFYFDSACQSLRPQPVIAAMNKYYTEYNACGGRVKYEWGKKVDEKVAQTRSKILKFLRKSEKDYVAGFTLNTTYGINLVLSQLPIGKYGQVITSEIEHNSVFLPTITAAKRLGIPRRVLERDESGVLIYNPSEIEKAVAVLNTTSNIDGRNLENAGQLADDLHKSGGILFIDAAQTMAHNPQMLHGLDFDGLFFSGHKVYGPSLGVWVLKRSLLESLDISFIGGGSVDDVHEKDYVLTAEDLANRLEMGLQAFGEIIGLGAAFDWLSSYKPEGMDMESHLLELSRMLYDGLDKLPIVLLNRGPSPIVSFYSEKIDAHKLAIFLSQQKIMARSGYFCCHYYLKNSKNLPPVLRISLGAYNTKAQVEHLLEILNKILTNI